MAAKITLVAILIFSMEIPFLGYVLGNRKEKSFKASLAVNLVLFFGTVVVADMLLFSGHIYAASDTAASAAEGWRYMAAALSTGLSCIGARCSSCECGIRSNRSTERGFKYYG